MMPRTPPQTRRPRNPQTHPSQIPPLLCLEEPLLDHPEPPRNPKAKEAPRIHPRPAQKNKSTHPKTPKHVQTSGPQPNNLQAPKSPRPSLPIPPFKEFRVQTLKHPTPSPCLEEGGAQHGQEEQQRQWQGKEAWIVGLEMQGLGLFAGFSGSCSGCRVTTTLLP